MRAIVHDPIVPITSVTKRLPDGLVDIIMAGLQKDPMRRPTLMDIASALGQLNPGISRFYVSQTRPWTMVTPFMSTVATTTIIAATRAHLHLPAELWDVIFYYLNDTIFTRSCLGAPILMI